MIDSAIRDSDAFARSPFGCYARDAVHRGPYKNGPGEVNVSVCICGCVVSPGDVVVGDADGVVTFAPGTATELLAAVRAQEAKEAEALEMIRAGRYDGRYGCVR